MPATTRLHSTTVYTRAPPSDKVDACAISAAYAVANAAVDVAAAVASASAASAAAVATAATAAVAAAAGSSSRVNTKVAQKVVLKGGKGGATSKRDKGGEAKGGARYSADASIDNKAFFLASNKINRKSNVIIYGEKADVKHAGGGVGNSGGTGPSGGAGGANNK